MSPELPLLYNPEEWFMNLFYFLSRSLFIILLKFSDSVQKPSDSHSFSLLPPHRQLTSASCPLPFGLTFQYSAPQSHQELNIWLPWRHHMKLESYVKKKTKKTSAFGMTIINATIIKMNQNTWHISKIGRDFIWINGTFWEKNHVTG